MIEDKQLSVDKDVFLSEEAVRRPLRPWSASIHRFLEHLRNYGLPVPRVLGTDGEYEYLEYLPGGQVHPYAWSDEGLWEVGRLARRLHDCARSFRVPADAVCQNWCMRELGCTEGRIWCHGDLAPWNVITTPEGLPCGLIDWEFTGPLDPLTELARMCWLFVQLHDDDLAVKYDLPDPKGRARQVRVVADAYGLSKDEREGLTERILEVAICETAHEAIDAKLVPGSHGDLWGLAWRSRSVYWIWRNRTTIHGALIKN